jgi:putative NADH-flavin reductase
MKLLILGVTGETGKLIIEKALSRGHQVNAYARSPQKIDQELAQKINVFKGDLTDIAAIVNALDGVDTVISALGPAAGHSNDLPITKGYKVLIECMKEKNVNRLIALSTSSCVDENDKFSFTTSLAITMVKLMAKSSYNDIIESGKVIKDSGLDWTLYRVGILTNGEETQVKTGYVGDTSLIISRKNIAKFCIDEAENNQFIRKSPTICSA